MTDSLVELSCNPTLLQHVAQKGAGILSSPADAKPTKPVNSPQSSLRKSNLVYVYWVCGHEGLSLLDILTTREPCQLIFGL